ncbi:MAG: hypothetical protein KDH94_02130, partial [Coxiellaceae bacterium]|nr:hypothetical protein [Coxiellaceae bacterium]
MRQRILPTLILLLAPLLTQAADQLSLPISNSQAWQPKANLEIEAGKPSNGMIDFLAPLSKDSQSTLLIDARAGIANAVPNFPQQYQQKFVSLAIAYRKQIGNAGTYGEYIAIDRDKTIFNTYASQAVFGVEWLSAFDFRANLYLPYGHKTISLGDYYADQPVLTGHSVYLEDFDNSITYQSGFDTEIGTRITLIPGLHLFGGYYYFAKKDKAKSIKGISARLDDRLTNCLHIIAHYSHDHIQGTQFTFGIRLHFGDTTSSKNVNNTTDRQMQMIQRHRGIQASPGTVYKGLRLVKQNVFYINSTAAANGDGTFENPFQSSTEYNTAEGLGTIPANAFIYFYRGDGSTYSTLNTLTGTQEIFGQAQNWVEQGVTIIPGSEALRPNINNVSASGINRISGMGFVNTVNTNTTPAVVISSGNTTLDNVVIGNGGPGYRFGVQLIQASASIVNSTIRAESDAAAGANTALIVLSTIPNQTLTVSNTTIIASSTQTDTAVMGINIGGGFLQQMNATFDNTTITAIGNDPDEQQRVRGIFVTGGAANSTITFNGGSISATNTSTTSTAGERHADAVETGSGSGFTVLNNVSVTATISGPGFSTAVNADAIFG